MVDDYVRWRPGLAGAMNQVTAARSLELLKYADRADWPLAIVAGLIAGVQQVQLDQGSGRHYTAGQEAARAGVAGGLTATETVIAGATGMAIGAAVGSVVPGAGTVVGAGIGFVVGAGIAVGSGVLIDHFHMNDALEKPLFSRFPTVFGG